MGLVFCCRIFDSNVVINPQDAWKIIEDNYLHCTWKSKSGPYNVIFPKPLGIHRSGPPLYWSLQVQLWVQCRSLSLTFSFLLQKRRNPCISPKEIRRLVNHQTSSNMSFCLDFYDCQIARLSHSWISWLSYGENVKRVSIALRNLEIIIFLICICPVLDYKATYA